MDFKTAGLSAKEFDALVEELGREPNEIELRLFGVMWSEHCSYKSTRPLLKLFPTEGPAVLQGPGENAGVVDLGKGIGLAFKVESHNHPSAVEPYQGAATGVGGIIRDIIAMGARPVASMDGLFFGPLTSPRVLRLRDGIVRGVGGYGNAVGVPTVGGKTVYDPSYADNPLVNAFCAGVVSLEKLVLSQTARPGQKVLLLGSRTGRDGIAGAAFASVELSENTQASRPQVQIGDPFAEKLLIECCLELLQENLVAAMQDMGAAGVVSSSSEVAAKSGVGMVIDMDRIPLRESGMTPWEIALSESQERMLLVVEPPLVEEVVCRAQRWGLECTEIGVITEERRYIYTEGGHVVVDLPPELIGGNAPVITWASRPPQDFEARGRLNPEALVPPEDGDFGRELCALLGDPNLGSKEMVYEQYDSMVQTNTLLGPGGDVSVIRVPQARAHVAFSMEADPWKCFTDPFTGGAETVARAVRALAVCGATPLGLTDCLNFPSPEKPEQFWELQEVLRGMAEACKVLTCPVVSGNVSLYNESPSGRILPTPVVVAAGVLPEDQPLLLGGRWCSGDRIFLVGPLQTSLGASRYVCQRGNTPRGKPFPFSGNTEADFAQRARDTAKNSQAHSGRVLAGGGLAVALAKEVVTSGLGARISLPLPLQKDVLTLFGEGGPRALYAVAPELVASFRHRWEGYPLTELGTVEGSRLQMEGVLDLSCDELFAAWRGNH